MDAKQRDYFDNMMEQVLASMPEQVHQLLDEVTMYVEDYPSTEFLIRWE